MKVLGLIVCAALFAFPALAQTPPGNVYETSPFNANPKYFTSTNCGAPFSCSAESDSDAMIKMANQCVSRKFPFPNNIMSRLMSRGTYKGCVIPSTYAPSGPGLGAKAQWPICCVQEGDNNTCQMVCHFYLTNEAG